MPGLRRQLVGRRHHRAGSAHRRDRRGDRTELRGPVGGHGPQPTLWPCDLANAAPASLRTPERSARSLLTIGSATAIVASFLPWLRSGSVEVELRDARPRGAARLRTGRGGRAPQLGCGRSCRSSLTGAVVAAWWSRRWHRRHPRRRRRPVRGHARRRRWPRPAPTRPGWPCLAAPAWTAIGAGVVLLGSLATVLVRVPSAHGVQPPAAD